MSEALVWPEVSQIQLYEIYGIPVAAFVVFLIFFNIWPTYELAKPAAKKKEAKTGGADELAGLLDKEEGTTYLAAGECRGDYSKDWMESYDYTFLLLMSFVLALLIVWTGYEKPELFLNGTFWMYQAPKPIVMIVVSVLCGLICRKFTDGIDADGYIQTTKHSKFKVNYTRKVQHFMAYFIPLVIQAPESCNCDGLVETAWGEWLTLLTFLLMIKPIREASVIFMLQFNSLDRPEDRPDTLEWITLGNIIPGMLMILFFKSIFPVQNQELVLIFVFVTGIGDGLAEPVGITWGKHKYRCGGFQNPIVLGKEAGSCGIAFRSVFSNETYGRSYEGSACVFLSGMIFTSMQYQFFDNSTQFWVCFWLQGPLMALAEAISPHTMDTPFLMGLGGLSIFYILKWF